MKVPEIADKALEAFQTYVKIKAKWTNAPNHKWDGFIDIYFDRTKPTRFIADVRKDVRNQNIPQFLQPNGEWPILVVAENIYPKTKEELQKNNVCYLETTGDAYINIPPTHLIWIDHKKPKIKTKELNRAFTKTGLKVVYLFLLGENNINLPYREIAQKAEVGLGNVNYIINGLKEWRLIAKKNDKELLLHDKRALLDRWITAYDQRLKPALLLGKFKFPGTHDFLAWRKLKLQPNMTLWGGEPAGDLYTDNLNPEILTIYTIEPRADLMRKYKLVPDKEGNVYVYKKFWKDVDEIIKNAAPPILAYADLINTGNKRCIETAPKAL